MGGALPIYICNMCGRDVVWCTSVSTGRKYLVDVTAGAVGQRFYVGGNLHECDERQSDAAQAIAAEQAGRDLAVEMRRIQQLPMAERLAALEAL